MVQRPSGTAHLDSDRERALPFAAVPQLSLHTPIGDLSVSEEDGAIVAVDWGWGSEQTETALLRRARDQLHAYFDGELTAFDLPLAPRGHRIPAARMAGAVRDPLWRDPQLPRHRAHRRRQSPLGRPGQRQQPDPDHHSVPPRRRHHASRRLFRRRRSRHQALAAGARGTRTAAAPAHPFRGRLIRPASTENIMIKAIRIHSPGGPEVMKWEDVPRPEPGPGEALIKQEAVGLNYIDVYFRSGLYKAPTMPLIIGQEGAGTVVAVGSGRDRGEAGRPRRLCRRARRLCDRAGDRRRPAGEAARRHRLQDRRGDDAAGHDGAVPRSAAPTR